MTIQSGLLPTNHENPTPEYISLRAKVDQRRGILEGKGYPCETGMQLDINKLSVEQRKVLANCLLDGWLVYGPECARLLGNRNGSPDERVLIYPPNEEGLLIWINNMIELRDLKGVVLPELVDENEEPSEANKALADQRAAYVAQKGGVFAEKVAAGFSSDEEIDSRIVEDELKRLDLLNIPRLNTNYRLFHYSGSISDTSYQQIVKARAKLPEDHELELVRDIEAGTIYAKATWLVGHVRATAYISVSAA
jgi:hypothetical protein